jgi:NADPH:quinone reductase-like Zn-dependent oxidoreductase
MIASAKPACDEVAATSNTRYFRFLTESDGGRLSDIAALVDAAKIEPVIDRVFPFNNIVDALLYAAQGRARGKVVIDMKSN